eukprot:5841282-Amphidinium_carterae.6
MRVILGHLDRLVRMHFSCVPPQVAGRHRSTCIDREVLKHYVRRSSFVRRVVSTDSAEQY